MRAEQHVVLGAAFLGVILLLCFAPYRYEGMTHDGFRPVHASGGMRAPVWSGPRVENIQRHHALSSQATGRVPLHNPSAELYASRLALEVGGLAILCSLVYAVIGRGHRRAA